MDWMEASDVLATSVSLAGPVKVEARGRVVKAWALELGLPAFVPVLATCFMPDLRTFSVS